MGRHPLLTQQKDRLCPSHLHGHRWKSPWQKNIMHVVTLSIELPGAGLIPSRACWRSSRRGCLSQKIAGTFSLDLHGTCNQCVTLRMITLMLMPALMLMMMIITSPSTPIVGLESLLSKPVVHVPFLLVAQYLVGISYILELFIRVRRLVLGEGKTHRQSSNALLVYIFYGPHQQYHQRS